MVYEWKAAALHHLLNLKYDEFYWRLTSEEYETDFVYEVVENESDYNSMDIHRLGECVHIMVSSISFHRKLW